VPTTPLYPLLEQRFRRAQDAMLREQQTPEDALHASAQAAQQLLDTANVKPERTAPGT
jgi:hypothetical protein